MADRIKGLPRNKFYNVNSARKWARNFRKWAKKKKNQEPMGQTVAFGVNKDALLKVLNQEGAAGIRIYMGIDDDGPKAKKFGRPVESTFIVAVDENNNDILESRGSSKDSKKMTFSEDEIGETSLSDNQGMVLQDLHLCPPMCGDSTIGGEEV